MLNSSSDLIVIMLTFPFISVYLSILLDPAKFIMAPSGWRVYTLSSLKSHEDKP